MSVQVIRSTIASPFVGAANRMYIQTETGSVVLAVPYAPNEIAFDGLTSDWVSTDRSGASPLLLRKGDSLITMKFSLKLADTDFFATQTSRLSILRTLGKTRERVLVRFGPEEAGLWRLTDMSIQPSQHHPDTNEATQAIASLTFTEASDAAPAVGPVNPPPPPAPPVTAPPPAATRIYVVVKGDCLWKIALHYYGNGALWPRLFDANRNQIKKPDLIYPGQRFVIP
jgi:hypothetical protein